MKMSKKHVTKLEKLTSRIHSPRGQPGSIMVKDLPDGSNQDWALDCTSQLISLHLIFGLVQTVTIIADPYVEESHRKSICLLRDSFLPEQLPEASFELTHPVPPRTIQARTRTTLEQGRSISHFR